MALVKFACELATLAKCVLCESTCTHLYVSFGHAVVGDAHRDQTDIRDRSVFDELSDASQPLATLARLGGHTNTNRLALM